MKTPATWLEEVLGSVAKLDNWLQRQYVGECLAYERMMTLAKNYELSSKEKTVLEIIAKDEQKHSSWILKLLLNRQITIPRISYDEDRYWKATLTSNMSKDQLFAIGHHAEDMRLRRIKLLSSDTRVTDDIRTVFGFILKDEKFHSKAFKNLASKEALTEMAGNHKAGLDALGLSL